MVSGAVFAGLIAGGGHRPARARQVVRAVRQLVPAVRRRRPDLHADPEPRGRRRLLLPEAAPGAIAAERKRTSRRGPSRAATRLEPRRGPATAASRSPSAASTPSTTSTSRSSEGQLVGLIGPNGAGKTTFVDADHRVRAYTRPVVLDGRDLAGWPRTPARGAASPGRGRPPSCSTTSRCAENLTVAAERPSFLSLAAELIGRAPTTPRRTRRSPCSTSAIAEAMPAELTQGQRKLVGVARALAMQPRLLASTSQRPASTRRERRARPAAAPDRRRGHDDAADRPRHGPRAQHLRPRRRARVRQGDRGRARPRRCAATPAWSTAYLGSAAGESRRGAADARQPDQAEAGRP